MLEINPIKLKGQWKDGYALDYHTLKSVFLGVDQWGHNQFETTRSKLGELVYQLKYNQNISVLDEIIDLISPFLKWWNISSKVNAIIPVPPSNSDRQFQPVFKLSEYIGEYLKIPVFTDVLVKNNQIQAKNLDIINKNKVTGTIIRQKRFTSEVNILVIDDLYQTGITLNESFKVLKTDSNIKDIYVLTLTKTRR